ncbi:MAG: flagellar hook-length control protein FliK [Lachnospiraceae bacterium]|nr:flagellar hook-length control protein FliK [Lachnospiraceae bacterium]
MNIQIISQGYQQNQVQGSQDALTAQTLQQLKQQLNLSAGQILSGRVTAMEGNQIQLLLDSRQTLSAQLTGELPINVGQLLSFEVKSAAGQMAELRPLYTNLSADSTVGSALSEASLPMTDRNVSMVEHMMEEGMSVNKQALLDMVNHLEAHPDVSPQTLVQMQKLDLPLDEATITQFENYKNFEHQIGGDVQDLSRGLASLPQELIEAGKPEQAFLAASDVLEMALSGEETIPLQDAAALPPEVIEADLAQLKELITPEETPAQTETVLPEQEAGEKAGEAVVQQQAVAAEEVPVRQSTLPELTVPREVQEQRDAEAKPVQEETAARDLTPPKSDTQTVIPEETQVKTAEPETLLTLSDRLVKAFKAGNPAFTEEAKETLKEALQDPFLKDAISEKLSQKFLLKPEDVGKEGKVEELYRRILEHSAKAMEVLESNNPGSQALRSAQNLTDNVQFMNHLNEMMAYVQLPLKMSEENAHGDLYVYTNKKKKAAGDDKFTALLHLDMEHLGPMDVYVALQKEKVSTHFYMQDEQMLDFIEAHIHLLNERLQKKGYQMNTTVSVKEDGSPRSVIDEFLTQENDGSVSRILSTQSFDVRA